LPKAAKRNGSLTPQFVERVATDYDLAMAQRTFGYEVSSPWRTLLGEPSFKDTSMPIPDEVPAFVDEVLLEGRISSHFHADPGFRSYAAFAEQGVCVE
jgi:hypothetical protein